MRTEGTSVECSWTLSTWAPKVVPKLSYNSVWLLQSLRTVLFASPTMPQQYSHSPWDWGKIFNVWLLFSIRMKLTSQGWGPGKAGFQKQSNIFTPVILCRVPFCILGGCSSGVRSIELKYELHPRSPGHKSSQYRLSFLCVHSLMEGIPGPLDMSEFQLWPNQVSSEFKRIGKIWK